MKDSHTNPSKICAVDVPRHLRIVILSHPRLDDWWKDGSLKKSTRKLRTKVTGSKHFNINLGESRIHHTELCYCFASLTVNLYYLLVTETLNNKQLSTTVPIAV